MEGAEPLPKGSLSVLPKLTTASPLITKRAQHPKILKKDFFDKLRLPGIPGKPVCHASFPFTYSWNLSPRSSKFLKNP